MQAIINRSNTVNSKAARQSGIELLRILAICGVVILHYNDGNAFKFVVEGSINQYILILFESIAICAVDLFILISGYFLSTSQKRSILKVLELFIELYVLRFAYYFASVLCGNAFSLSSLLSLLIPDNYFVVLYCVIYFMSPYINVLINQLDDRRMKSFVVILLTFFSIWNIAVDVFEELVGKEYMGLSTITAWGSKQGFNIVNFALLYIIGAFIRRFQGKIFFKKSSLTIGWIASTVCIYCWALLGQNMTRYELRGAWVYHNPLIILNCVCLFLLLSRMKFKSRIINDLAGASFTCLLLHSLVLGRAGIEKAAISSPVYMTIHLLVSVLAIYLISWVFYKLYSFVTGWFFGKLSHLSIFQSKDLTM